ncbi:dipeptidase PepV [Bacillus sp. 165]|uniref:dipeptidase PepV n=1 Tax=Bacillus sp. 165 TaxID=1529117 RepID=UPI001AD9F2F9|nr:dipeptidase PepV [Bacillus sp. 165]MBO9130881.1 dipeptidase PepV [Bacillus sp. 165]
MTINWVEEVEKRKEQLIRETQQFLQIKSVLDEGDAQENAPFGTGIQKALEYVLNKGDQDGFTVKNLQGYAGHVEFGQGEELIGILCHVDVVPEGDGWTTDAYSADIREGKIFARGAIDDKGPTMAAYYAMKVVKESGLPLTKRVRMILGTDEESQWRCVDHYFKHEEMPTMGFAPDADFPIINAEKGMCNLYLVQEISSITSGINTLLSFQSGRRLNMVPDLATAKVQVHENSEEWKSCFEEYLSKMSSKGTAMMQGDIITFEIEGVSAHGSTPEKGRNAGQLLAGFLEKQLLDENGTHFINFTMSLGDTRGEKLGIAHRDDITGELTTNIGQFSYCKETGGKLGINIRYPVTTDFDSMLQAVKNKGESSNFTVQDVTSSRPHHVDKEHILIRTLQRVYEEQTGEQATLLSIGGATYARSLRAGVAFGPLFPGKEDLAHQKDEYIEIEELIKAASIYAQAIYELAR